MLLDEVCAAVVAQQQQAVARCSLSPRERVRVRGNESPKGDPA
jgi:hypothetical protein